MLRKMRNCSKPIQYIFTINCVLNETKTKSVNKARLLFSFLQVKTGNVLKNKSGQGTTEYAILVGVLVVIAIIAISLFRPKIQELWDAIAAGINGL